VHLLEFCTCVVSRCNCVVYFFVVEEEKNAQVSCMNNICILSWLLVLLG